MNRFYIIIIALQLMVGCTLINDLSSSVEEGNRGFSDNEIKNASGMFQQGDIEAALKQSSGLLIQDKVSELVADMTGNIRNIDSDGRIAVTNFVPASSNFEHSPMLSHTIANAFMSELHRFGLTVLDFKVANYIRVTEGGDFVMTRDFLELQDTIDTDYVLVGTLSEYRGGMLVHARVVDFSSKAMLSSAEAFIPAREVNMLMQNSH